VVKVREGMKTPQSKRMFAILETENPDINEPLRLGGGLVLFGSKLTAEEWKKWHLSVEKREMYKVYPVTVEFDPEKGFELHSEIYSSGESEGFSEDRQARFSDVGKGRFTKAD